MENTIYFRDMEDLINKGITKVNNNYYVRFGFWNPEDTYYDKTIVITLFSKKHGAVYTSVYGQDIIEKNHSIEKVVQDQLNSIKEFENSDLAK